MEVDWVLIFICSTRAMQEYKNIITF